MVDLHYQPTFHHDLWVDRQDRVLADGSNGFNVRFDAIERDLRQASTVVGQISDALAEATAPPPGPVQGRLTLTPVMFLPTAVGVPTVSIHEFDQGSSDAMNLVLPNGVRLQNLRAVLDLVGGDGFATFTLSLARLPLHLTIPPPSVQTLATVTRSVFGSSSEHVAVDDPITAALATVDLTAFRYFLTASLVGQSISPVTVFIDSVQIQYTS